MKTEDITTFIDKETLQNIHDHNTIVNYDLLDKFPDTEFQKELDGILHGLACSLQTRTIIPQQLASTDNALWIFLNKEGTQTLSQDGDELKFEYPAGTSSSLYYFNSPLTRDCYVEAEFADLEPGTMNCIFLTSSINNFGNTDGYLAVQTAPTSRDPASNSIIGEGWTAIMEFDITTTSHTPKVLTWAYDIEPFGKFRLSRNSTNLKLHRNFSFCMSALSHSYIQTMYAGFFSYSFASENPSFTIIKNLKCGNY